MSSAWPSAGVSTTTGAPAAAHTATSASGSMVPSAMLACRSRAEPNSSRELFRCTRSIRPVIALARSTTSTRSSPAAKAWQVSRQKPTPNSPTASQSRASASKWRAIAWSPPAVFSMNTGTAKPPSSCWRWTNLRQLSTPVAGVLARGDVPAVHDQPDRPDLGRPVGVLHHQLARRDPDPVVDRGQVDHVRRVHHHRHRAAAQLLGLGVRRRLLPALRVGQEHLHDVGTTLGRRGDRVVLAHVGPDEHAVSVVTGPDGSRSAVLVAWTSLPRPAPLAGPVPPAPAPAVRSGSVGAR